MEKRARMEEPVVSLCDGYVNGDQREEEIPRTLAKRIASHSIELLTLVEALGLYLTSADVGKRTRGTELLSNTLAEFYQFRLSRNEVGYLVTFYCDRLKDSPLVTPHALRGIMALVSLQELSDEDAVNIVRTLFREIHNQSLQQPSRNVFYVILHLLLKNYSKALRQISSEFILGFIQSMDGEKDPRNLQIAFDCVLLITRHLELDVLVEDLFEVISCYFPINFTASSTDSDSVSKDDLVLGLRKCLTSTPKFATFCLPLLLEKLSSDIQSAKHDSLLTLAAGMSTFDISSLSLYTPMLWEDLKREIFHPVSDSIEAASLGVITDLCKALTLPMVRSDPSSDALTKFIDLVRKDTSHHLCEPELRLMKPAASIIVAIARGSSRASYIAADTFLSLLIQQLVQHSQVSKKQVVLEAILQLIQSFKPFSSPENGSPFTQYSHSLFPFLLSSLNENSSISYTNLVIVTIAAVINLECLSLKEVEECTSHLIQFVFTPAADKGLSHECIQALGLVSQLYPRLMRDSFLPSLLSQLQQSDPSLPVSVIAAVSAHADIIVETLPSLVQLLEELNNGAVSDLTHSVAVLVSEAIAAIITTESETETRDFIHHKTIPDIIRLCVHSSVSGSEVIPCDAVLNHIASSLHHHNLVLDQQVSAEWSGQVINLFMTGTDPFLNPESHSFSPLQATSPWQQTQTVSLLTSILSSSRPQFLVVTGLEVMDSLVQLSLNCSQSFTHVSAAKGCCCLANKMEDSLQFRTAVEESFNKIWLAITDTSRDNEERNRALSLWLWIAKGLIMRSHSIGTSAVDKLMMLFEDEVTARRAADGFYLLLSDTNELLSQSSHANIKLFYKQQLFSVCVPKLVELFRTSSLSIVRENVLRALSHIMQSVPKQVLLPNLPRLFPLLLDSLQNPTNEMGVVLSSLEATYSLILDAPVMIGQHLTSLVPPLLTLAQTSPYMKIRINALRCIGAMTTLPTDLLYPYQSQIITGLSPCLDDKKRLVRKEAVMSRCEWYLLGHEEKD